MRLCQHCRGQSAERGRRARKPCPGGCRCLFDLWRVMAQARKKRILCIEDDRETAALIEEDLLERGYEVILASDGREGFAAMLKHMPDLVLSDISMPVDFDVLATIITARLAGIARMELWPRRIALNDREVETLTWVARGKTSAEIARILGLSKRTVDFHIDNARDKLGAATRSEAVIKAADGGLIEP